MMGRTMPVLVGSFVVSCLFTFILPLSPPFGVLVSTRAMAGLFSGLVILVQSYIIKSTSSDERKRGTLRCAKPWSH